MRARLLLAVVYLILFGVGDARGEELAFKIVAHPDVGVESVSRSDLNKIFMRKRRALPSGERAKPVDQAADSKIREHFTRTVFSKSVSALRSYWRQQIFSGGGVPPPEKPDDVAVVQYVASTKGAVGYVSKDTPAEGVKILKLTD